jgi:hypothetical protein
MHDAMLHVDHTPSEVGVIHRAGDGNLVGRATVWADLPFKHLDCDALAILQKWSSGRL